MARPHLSIVMQSVSDPDAKRPTKRSRSSEDEENNDLGSGAPCMTITFSLNDEKGALAKVLKPFEVGKT